MNMIVLNMTVGFDVIAPTLSGVQAFPAGTSVSLSWSTDEANGTAFYVRTASATPPTAQQIINGQNHTGATAITSGSRAVNALGSQTAFSESGLAVGTYYFHLVHRDGGNNISDVVSSNAFTISAPSGRSATINVIKGGDGLMAPQNFILGVDLTGFTAQAPGPGEVHDPRMHDVQYKWFISDNYGFTKKINHAEGFETNGTAIGPIINTVIRSTSTVTIYAEVTEIGTDEVIRTPDLTINLADAATLVTGTNRIFVDGDGGGTAPAGSQRVRTLSDAWAILSGSEVGDWEIVMRHDIAHSWGGNAINGNLFPRAKIRSEAGGRAVINMTGGLYINDTAGTLARKFLTIQGCELVGPWDPISRTGDRFVSMIINNNPLDGFLLADDCIIRGFLHGVAIEGSTEADQLLVVNDCHITDWQGYGIYGSHGTVGARGNLIAQNVNAFSGDGSVGTQGGPIRCAVATTILQTNNDFFGNGGWFVNVPGYFSNQPATRSFTSPVRGGTLVQTGNAYEAGVSLSEIKSHGVGGQTIQGQAINAIVTNNEGMGTHMTYYIVETHHFGLTVHSNKGIFPDVQRIDATFNPRAFVGFGTGPNGNTAESLGVPNSIKGNTVINLMSDANTPDGAAQSIPILLNQTSAPADVENNLLYQPNVGGFTNPTNIDMTQVGDPQYTGYSDPDTPLVTGTITADANWISGALLVGSDAEGAATGTPSSGDVPRYDLAGNRRTGAGPFNLGAQ